MMSNTPPEQTETLLEQTLLTSVEVVSNEKNRCKKRSIEDIEDDLIEIDIEIKKLKKQSIFFFIFIFFIKFYL